MIRHSFPTGKRQSGFWRPDNSMSVILFLIFLSAVFSVIYTDSNEASSEQQRRLTYGSWHAAIYGTAPETFWLLQSHATVQSAGFMEIYGTVLDHTDGADAEIGRIGFADPNAVSIGNITLLEGRFPETVDEIAVELSSLIRLGLDRQTGQQITITISEQNGSNSPKTNIRSYQLCGIIQNYSRNWKTGQNPLPSFFVSQDSSDTAKRSGFHVFVQMKPAFAANARSLLEPCSWYSYFTQNDFTYLQYTKESAHKPAFSVWQMILLLSVTLFTLALTQADIRQRYRSFLILRTLGASKKQILLLFLQKKVRMICISSIPGILCGMLAAYLISRLPGGAFVWPDICSFQAAHLLETILCLYAGVILSITVNLIPLLHIPLHKKPQKQLAKAHPPRSFLHRTKQRKGNRLLPGRHFVTVLFRAADRRQNFFQTALTFAVAIFIYILAYQAWNAGSIYLRYQKNVPEDYTFGNLTSDTPPHAVITEDALLQIQNTYGVKDAIAVAVSDNCEITFSGAYDRQYAAKVHSVLAEKNRNLPDAPVSGIFIGCPDALLPIYADSLDSDVLGELLAEDEIILYLPDYSVSADGSLSDPETSYAKQAFTERTIAVGDDIWADTGKTVKKLRIAGIIRSFPDTFPESYRLIRPYSIICSQSTYRKIFGQVNYAFVQVYQDPTAISYQTAVELSNQENGLYFHNKRPERIRLSQYMISQTMLALLLGTSAFLAAMSIRFGLYSFYGKQIYERYQTLYRLGMPKSAIKRTLLKGAFGNSFAGCGIAAVLFLSFADHVNRLFFGFLFFIVFALNFLVLAIYDNWNVKKPF